MQTLRCLVVDDEKLAGELLADYIGKVPELELAAVCQHALSAKSILKDNLIDLLFLDIHMPDLTGLELLRILKKPPLTVLTTAYSEYAVESYELDVLDYLVKPIEFERFYKAVNKAIDRLTPAPAPTFVPAAVPMEISIPPADDFFFVKGDHQIHKVNYNDLLYVESLREYARLHTTQERIVTRVSLSRLEELLPPEQFFRIHRTYLINISHIQRIEGNMVHLGNERLVLSKGKREEFLSLINKKGLY